MNLMEPESITKLFYYSCWEDDKCVKGLVDGDIFIGPLGSRNIDKKIMDSNTKEWESICASKGIKVYESGSEDERLAERLANMYDKTEEEKNEKEVIECGFKKTRKCENDPSNDKIIEPLEKQNIDKKIEEEENEVINMRDRDGNTMLHNICKNDSIGTLKKLFEFGKIDVDICNYNGKTAFEVACENSSNKCIAYLINNKLINITLEASYVACRYLNLDGFKNFIAIYKDDIKKFTSTKGNFFSKKCSEVTFSDEKSRKLYVEKIKYLIVATEVDVIKLDDFGSSVLHNLCMNKKFDILNALIEINLAMDFSVRDMLNRTPIQYIVSDSRDVEKGPLEEFFRKVSPFFESGEYLLSDKDSVFSSCIVYSKTRELELFVKYFGHLMKCYHAHNKHILQKAFYHGEDDLTDILLDCEYINHDVLYGGSSSIFHKKTKFSFVEYIAIDKVSPAYLDMGNMKKDENGKLVECSVCQERSGNVVFAGCEHSMCAICCIRWRMKNTTFNCHLCRKEIKDVNVYVESKYLTKSFFFKGT